jgi:exopolysaccharide biosynthesis polyprenyl glycosylphosphotransferase
VTTVNPAIAPSRPQLLVPGSRAVSEIPRSTDRRRRIVILGSGPMAAKLVEEIESTDALRHVIAGVVDDERPDAQWAKRTRYLGAPARLAEIVERERPERIVVAFADRRDRLPLQLLLESRVRGVIVEDAVEYYERLTGKMAIEVLKPSSLILSKGFRNHGTAEIIARVVSVVASAIGLILSAPLLLGIAILVKLDSRGPVLFVQERAGRNGRPFGLLKFRTMHPCSEQHSEWVRDNEHRITRIGRWLRRFRLDELPQLVNVLKGEMNLIGPRPHPTANHEIFMDRIAYYPVRSTVRPGVTGWAQVRYGYANDLEEETEKMRYDLYYIKNWSLWLDVKILFRTVGIMLVGQGASEVRGRTPRQRGGRWSPAPTRATNEAAYAPCLVASRPSRPAAGRR